MSFCPFDTWYVLEAALLRRYVCKGAGVRAPFDVCHSADVMLSKLCVHKVACAPALWMCTIVVEVYS